jgi:hypothetical protein
MKYLLAILMKAIPTAHSLIITISLFFIEAVLRHLLYLFGTSP